MSDLDMQKDSRGNNPFNLRVGLGYDVHPFAESNSSRRLVLAGVTFDHVGLVGHSDADAVAHAVSDALLSPAGLGDLGSRFPATDERFRDANSMQLLAQVVELVLTERWCVGNVDIVINAEQPRLAPHISGMEQNLREVLRPLAPGSGHDDVFVAIQPKRGEGIGAIGRVEGIAVQAIALLMKTEPRGPQSRN